MKYKDPVWPVVAVIAVTCSALAIVSIRTRKVTAPVGTQSLVAAHRTVEPPPTLETLKEPERRKETERRKEPERTSAPPQDATTKSTGFRNLSLQPEALRMARLLGARFSSGTREKSILSSTVTVASEQRTVQTKRTQTDNGEQVEITIGGSSASLTWDGAQGALSSGARASGSDRELIERLVLDSPDQFVLAQLRGASYYTVARNVRPEGAGDNYKGPLWNIVRLDDPQGDEQKRPQSPWRLYYLNTMTGLIDKIISRLGGDLVEANLAGWTDVAGEKFPAQITWTRKGNVIMEMRLSSFAHSAGR